MTTPAPGCKAPTTHSDAEGKRVATVRPLEGPADLSRPTLHRCARWESEGNHAESEDPRNRKTGDRTNPEGSQYLGGRGVNLK